MRHNFSDNAVAILEDRYLLRNDDDEIVERPEEMIHRVCDVVAQNKEEHNTFKELLMSLKFLPNSPTLMNAKKKIGNLSACFTIPVEDSMRGIFKALQDQALVQKWGGNHII